MISDRCFKIEFVEMGELYELYLNEISTAVLLSEKFCSKPGKNTHAPHVQEMMLNRDKKRMSEIKNL